MPRSALSRLSAVSSSASRRTCRNNYIVWHYIKIVQPSTRCSTVSRRFSLPQPAFSLPLTHSLSRTQAQRQYFCTISILLLHITQNAIYFFKCSLKFSTLSPRTHTPSSKTKDNKTENSKSYNSNSNNNGKQWNLWSFGEFYAFSALGRRIKCLHVDLKVPPYLPPSLIRGPICQVLCICFSVSFISSSSAVLCSFLATLHALCPGSCFVLAPSFVWSCKSLFICS